MPPDPRLSEQTLYQEWDRLLTGLFDALEEDHDQTPASEPSGQAPGLQTYRDRVGQDLKEFHEKLSNIMESEKSGQ